MDQISIKLQIKNAVWRNLSQMRRKPKLFRKQIYAYIHYNKFKKMLDLVRNKIRKIVQS